MIELALEQDPEKAIQLALRAPARKMRHQFFKDYAKSESVDEPGNTFAWATALEDPTARAGAMEGAIRTWIKQDHHEAMQALAPYQDEAWTSDFFRSDTP